MGSSPMLKGDRFRRKTDDEYFSSSRSLTNDCVLQEKKRTSPPTFQSIEDEEEISRAFRRHSFRPVRDLKIDSTRKALFSKDCSDQSRCLTEKAKSIPNSEKRKRGFNREEQGAVRCFWANASS